MGMISKRTNKEVCGKWKVRTRHQRFFIYDFKAHNTIVQFLSSFSFDPSSSPCYIHFPFLLQQLRDRKLYLISTWVKTLLNSWAFWHKSQTSASPKVKLKYEREKRKGGAGQKKLGCAAWQMQVTVELSEKVVTCVLHYSCICPSQSQSSDWFFCRLASKSVSCSIFFTNGKKEGK